MKAVLASALTALVLVTTAWASNVTPAQLASLTRHVAKLDRQNRELTLRVVALENQMVKTQTLAYDSSDALNCLRKGWNSQKYAAYAVGSWGGFSTPSGNLSMFESPDTTQGTTPTGYLAEWDVVPTQC